MALKPKRRTTGTIKVQCSSATAGSRTCISTMKAGPPRRPGHHITPVLPQRDTEITRRPTQTEIWVERHICTAATAKLRHLTYGEPATCVVDPRCIRAHRAGLNSAAHTMFR